MDNQKLGRPKSKNPRNNNINFRVTKDELEKARDICIKNDIRYVDIFLEGIKVLSTK